ncbi:uncharacterized protein METZ01_LOCUS278106 [marine metagenome]|uniref:Uncharacterized protein n=1 Tax=marine metagenome TaxID=408172 RepID=A0A382KPT5_9ZZZZ
MGKNRTAATKQDIDDMLEKIQLGLEQVEQLISADDYNPDSKNYELRYYTRITSEAFRMLQGMVSTSEFEW